MSFDSRDGCVIGGRRQPTRDEAISNSDFHSEGTISLFWILEKELSLELHPIALNIPNFAVQPPKQQNAAASRGAAAQQASRAGSRKRQLRGPAGGSAGEFGSRGRSRRSAMN